MPDCRSLLGSEYSGVSRLSLWSTITRLYTDCRLFPLRLTPEQAGISRIRLKGGLDQPLAVLNCCSVISFVVFGADLRKEHVLRYQIAL